MASVRSQRDPMKTADRQIEMGSPALLTHPLVQSLREIVRVFRQVLPSHAYFLHGGESAFVRSEAVLRIVGSRFSLLHHPPPKRHSLVTTAPLARWSAAMPSRVVIVRVGIRNQPDVGESKA